MQNEGLSVYVHYPFCEAKCPYCDFNSHGINQPKFSLKYNDYKTLSNLYRAEIKYYFETILKSNLFRQKVKINTIFFGGGTPSLMNGELVFDIIQAILQYGYFENTEITLEANPSSIEAAKFADFSQAGVNRISIGVQALNEADLKVLGRVHSKNQALAAIDVARGIFDNYSIDLIYARHNQTLESWKEELNFALKNLVKNHISAYSLTIEKGTKYFELNRKGLITTPQGEAAEQFFEATNSILQEGGFENYEISNYAKNGAFSAHNAAYWSGADWIGIGPGAHSRITNNIGQRLAINNVYNPQKWSELLLTSGNGVQQNKILTSAELASELALMNLRYKGLDIAFIKDKFNIDILSFLHPKKVEQFCNDGFLNFDGTILKASFEGRKILNSLLCAILP